MSKKHLWTKKEDELLLKLKNQLNLHKWVDIAQTINLHFKGQKLTGKQCRDRFINKLSQNLCQRSWGSQEDQKLMKLLGSYGRRWSLIAQSLSGRSQNSIKNHYYARLRRSIRELDKFIKKYLSSSYSTVDSNFLNKVLSLSASKFSDTGCQDQQQVQKANNIIQFLFWKIDYSEPPLNQPDLLNNIQLIRQLGGITKIEETPKKQEVVSEEPYVYLDEPSGQVKVQHTPLYFYNPYCYFFCPFA